MIFLNNRNVSNQLGRTGHVETQTTARAIVVLCIDKNELERILFDRGKAIGQTFFFHSICIIVRSHLDK